MISIRRLAGLLAVAFCVVGASAASASAAAPAFRHNVCSKVEKTKGTYPTEAACKKNEKAGEEPREWNGVITEVTAGSKIPFTDKSGVEELRSAKHETITCTKDTSTGEITGPKTVGNVKVTYTGCTQGTSKIKCKSIPNPEKKSEGTEGKEEEIITNTVEGELGTVSEGTKVGEALKPVTGDVRFVTIKCGTLNVSVTGSVIGEVTPINKLQTTGDIVFAANAANTNQKYTEYENAKGEKISDHLTAFTENAWLVSADEITFSEAIEVT